MTYYELIKDAEHKLNSNKITLGEYEEMIKPLKQEIEQQPKTDVLDEIIDKIEQTRDKDKIAEYPYNRCIKIVEGYKNGE